MKELAREEREANWVHNNFSWVRHIYCVKNLTIIYSTEKIEDMISKMKYRRQREDTKKKKQWEKSVHMYLLEILS